MAFTLSHSSTTADKLCAQWLPLFQITNGYDAVYNWFNVLKQTGHYIIGYTIMTSHVHVVIAMRINTSVVISIG